jgi:hypothetical protein
MALSPGSVPFQATRNGTNDAFLAKISLQDTLALVRVTTSPNLELGWPVAPEFVLQTTTNLAAPEWVNSSHAQRLSNGWTTVTIPPTKPVEFFRLKR